MDTDRARQQGREDYWRGLSLPENPHDLTGWNDIAWSHGWRQEWEQHRSWLRRQHLDRLLARDAINPSVETVRLHAAIAAWEVMP